MAFKSFRMILGVMIAAATAWLIWGGVEGLIAAADPANADADALDSAFSVVGGLIIGGLFYWSLCTASRPKIVLENVFSIPELVKKLGFTIGLLCIYRIGYVLPLAGLDQSKLASWAEGKGAVQQALQQASILTGGNFQRSTILGLGIMPYITASIIFQLLVSVVPSLEKLRKEGPAGNKKIQEYTRYATVGLCIVQGTMWMVMMRSQQLLYTQYRDSTLVFVMGVLGLTAGTMFLMWVGEQIDEYGIGNGISLIIMAGIAARLPVALMELYRGIDKGTIGVPAGLCLLAAFVFVVAGAILITQGQRRIPIQQAKHTRGRRVYGGQRQYLPLRVNHGGVMPIIFASSLMIFPGVVFSRLASAWPNGMWGSIWGMISGAFQGGSFTYVFTFVILIFFFAFFWTTVQFRPKEMSEQLRDAGSFIPGLRPGRRTAEYLERVMGRITFCGAAFLAVIASLPMIVSAAFGIPGSISSFLGGTGLLIVVSVTLDLVQRIEANLVMRNYGGFLGGSTRIKGAYR